MHSEHRRNLADKLPTLFFDKFTLSPDFGTASAPGQRNTSITSEAPDKRSSGLDGNFHQAQ